MINLHPALKAVCASVVIALAGCETMYGAANHSDDTIKSDIALSMGLSPSDITLVSRRTVGFVTYVNVKLNRTNKEQVCRIAGGGWAAFGMRTPPSCGDIGTSKLLQ